MPELTPMLQHTRSHWPHVRISLELEKSRTPALTPLAAYADVVLCARGYALAQGYGDPRAFLRWLAASAPRADLFVGWGADGAYARTAQGAEHHRARLGCSRTHRARLQSTPSAD